MKRTQTTLERLKEERDEAYNRFLILNKAIEQLEPPAVVTSGWKEQSLVSILNQGVFCQTVTILKLLLHPNESILDSTTIRKKYVTSVSAALNSLERERRLVKFSIEGIKGDFYGLPQWMGDDDKPLAKYLTEPVKHLIQ